MKQYDYLVLGAGPAGLSFACHMLELTGKKKTLLVLEKEQEAGGLCRSVLVDGAPLDIGGGHFLDVKRPEVNKFLFQYMGEEEWKRYHRDSRIQIHGHMISYPIEANIWQFPLEEQIAYLKSIAVAGCNVGEEVPQEFVKWIYWKLGKKIAEDYMLPYNRKMYGEELSRLGTYWMEKLPQVSFEDTLRSCLQKKAYGKNPGHTEFFYPAKYGFGELWRRMAQSISDHMVYGAEVCGINLTEGKVTCRNGETYQGKRIITTIPWTCFEFMEGIPLETYNLIGQLKHTGIVVQYFEENLKTDAQWIYFPDESIPYHRILVRNNFCQTGKGYWTETNKERFSGGRENAFVNEYAYPLNTVEKPDIMNKLLNQAAEKNVTGLGRWGEHQHYNADVVVERALRLAETMGRKEDE